MIPKIDWKPSDIFQATDWNRIVSNAWHLFEVLGLAAEWTECPEVGVADLPYYDLVNSLEENLGYLSSVTDVPFQQLRWYSRLSSSYVRNPSYVDFNRWENLIYQIAFKQSQIRNLYAGTFTAGTNRIRQTLGRS